MSDGDPHANTKPMPVPSVDHFRDFYQQFERLRGVATSELSNGNHGDFLRTFLEAFARADYDNGKILLPAMLVLEKKYKLKDRFAGLQLEKTLDRSPGEPGLT